MFRAQEGSGGQDVDAGSSHGPNTSTLSVVILSSVLLISVTKPPAGSYARYVRPAVAFPEGPLSEE